MWKVEHFSCSFVLAIEIQAVVIKLWFFAVSWCFWCILILLIKICSLYIDNFGVLIQMNMKQLSTFHLPLGGDENVLAKVLVLWPIFVFIRRRYCQRILFVGATFLCTMSLEARKLYVSSLLLLQIRHQRQRHTLSLTPTVCGHAEACPSTTYAK